MKTDAPRSLRYTIVFDGGSLGNPGKGYGSYEIMSEGEPVRLSREEFGGRITNNQAEYMTLIEALKWLAADLGDSRSKATIEINGDSKLVINQINGVWKVKNERMIPLVEQAKQLLRQFGKTKIAWHPRAESVKRLGH
ncbi:MAG TPA: ribonuclease HI family protein [Thermomicrobiales bacterium]|nr:ribonuclease HI family protein [Thermomicrobiales bacterium]